MDPSLVSALSGALAQSRRVEVIANNIANADTPGFKANDLIFEEALQGAQAEDQRASIPEQPFKDSELLSRAGDERRVVLYGGDFTDLKAGGIKLTNNPLDVAIEGNGFLEVLTPEGVRLTRAGNLALDSMGRLVTRDGFFVLGEGSADPAQRTLMVGAGTVNIDVDGNIYQAPDKGGALIGKLSLLKVENPSALRKSGNNLFEAPQEAFAQPAGSLDGRAPASVASGQAGGMNQGVTPRANPLGSTTMAPRVRQGMLESSNVNPVSEMTRLIEAHRLFDQNTRLMQTSSDMSQKINEVGRF